MRAAGGGTAGGSSRSSWLPRALRAPTAAPLPARRALDLLHDAAGQRPAVVQEAGVEAAAGVGEADLRRLKRQFSSLKNTFLHYEVKNEFLAGMHQVGCC